MKLDVPRSNEALRETTNRCWMIFTPTSAEGYFSVRA